MWRRWKSFQQRRRFGQLFVQGADQIGRGVAIHQHLPDARAEAVLVNDIEGGECGRMVHGGIRTKAGRAE